MEREVRGRSPAKLEDHYGLLQNDIYMKLQNDIYMKGPVVHVDFESSTKVSFRNYQGSPSKRTECKEEHHHE